MLITFDSFFLADGPQDLQDGNQFYAPVQSVQASYMRAQFSSPTTVKLGLMMGYEILTQVGNNGTFYYPKLDLIATAMKLHDAINLPLTSQEHRDSIFQIRENEKLLINEEYRGHVVKLEYTSYLQ